MKKSKFLAGFTLAEMTIVVTLVSSLSVGTYMGVQKGRERECINNLQQIYKAAYMFSMDNGVMPPAIFFPSSESDPHGFHNILAQYGVVKGILFCPSLPEQVNVNGTNYIWNDTVSGKNADTFPSSTWLMTEMTAVSKNIPAPHTGGFGILYVGGNASTGPRVVFPEVAVAQQPVQTEKKEVGKPAEQRKTPPLKSGLNLLAEKQVVAGEPLKVSAFMSDSSGEPLSMKPGRLTITTDTPAYVEIPSSVEIGSGASMIEFTAVFKKEGRTSVKVRDENSGFESTCEIDVTAGSLYGYEFPLFPIAWEAGKPQKARICSSDRWGNRVEYTGEAVIASSTGTVSPAKVLLNKGMWEGDLVFNTAADKNALYVAGGNRIGFSQEFSIRNSTPAAARIISSGEPVAGAAYEIAVSVEDAYGNRCVDYAGTLDLILPEGVSADMKKIVISPGDAGMRRNSLTFFSAGDKKIQVSNSDVKGEKSFYVNPGNLASFSIKEIGVQEAGKPFDIVVRATDTWGNQVKGFYLKDSSGTAEYVNRDLTAGVWMETIVITKAGEHTVFMDNQKGISGKSNVFTVKPAAPEKIEIAGIPLALTAGESYAGSVAVEDRFGNTVSDYGGTIILDHPEELSVTGTSGGKNPLSVDIKAEKPGYYKLTARDKDNSSMVAEKNIFVIGREGEEKKADR